MIFGRLNIAQFYDFFLSFQYFVKLNGKRDSNTWRFQPYCLVFTNKQDGIKSGGSRPWKFWFVQAICQLEKSDVRTMGRNDFIRVRDNRSRLLLSFLLLLPDFSYLFLKCLYCNKFVFPHTFLSYFSDYSYQTLPISSSCFSI